MCKKYHSDHPITTWMRGKRNVHPILITIEKSFVKWSQFRRHTVQPTKYQEDHSEYELSQWEMTLQCIVVSHWLCPYPEWSVNMHVVRVLLGSVISFPPETNGFDFKCITFKHILVMDILDHFLWICHQVDDKGPSWRQANICSDKSLVLPGNKLLPEPLLTQSCVTTWRH